MSHPVAYSGVEGGGEGYPQPVGQAGQPPAAVPMQQFHGEGHTLGGGPGGAPVFEPPPPTYAHQGTYAQQAAPQYANQQQQQQQYAQAPPQQQQPGAAYPPQYTQQPGPMYAQPAQGFGQYQGGAQYGGPSPYSQPQQAAPQQQPQPGYYAAARRPGPYMCAGGAACGRCGVVYPLPPGASSWRCKQCNEFNNLGGSQCVIV